MTSARKALKSFVDLPLVIILGSTATGKSKLAIALAKAFNGEIVSADSMQVYKGLDIITNKVTAEERREVRHHMINIIEPPSEFTVVHFKDMAVNIIDGLHSQNKLPIVVGGTNYYIESLLWNFLIDTKSEEADVKAGLEARKEISNENKSLYERLQEVDPERAEQLHPNNIRKIARSLQIFRDSGRPHSELLREQKSKDGSSKLSGPIRFSKTLVFWLTCNQNELDQRISDRMEAMVSDGLADEISDFYQRYKEGKEKVFVKGDMEGNGEVCHLQKDCNDERKVNEDESTSHCFIGDDINRKIDEKSSLLSIQDQPDASNSTQSSPRECHPALCDTDNMYEEGLFQAIGLKEFHSYLTSTENDSEIKEKLFLVGLEKLKQTTIKYSKKQRTWVRNRFLARPSNNAPDIYELDVTSLQMWNESVLGKALQITKAFIDDTNIPFVPLERVTQDDGVDKNRKHVCHVCNDKIIIGDHFWNEHLRSRKHRKLISKRRIGNNI